MEKKVYVVTQGQYSDMTIEAVFTTRKKAQAFIDNEGDMNEEIEEFELDKNLRPLSTILTPCMERNGDVRMVLKRRDSPTNAESARVISSYMSDQLYLRCDIVTDSEERAIKVCNERRIQILAENRWSKEANDDKGKGRRQV